MPSHTNPFWPPIRCTCVDRYQRGLKVHKGLKASATAYEPPKLSRLGKIEEWTKGSVFAQIVQITVIAG